MTLSADTVNSLFSATSGLLYPLSSLAQSALSNGADLYTKGDYEGAARAFKRAIALDPSQETVVKAYDLMAKAYIQLGNTEEAIKAYTNSLRADPTNAEAYVSLGNIYVSLDQYDDAITAYAEAVKLDPTSSTNVYSLGQAYLATGRYQEAEARFEQVIRMDPSHYGGYYALGQTYRKEGNNEAAVQQFEKAISLKPDFYNAYVDLGSAYVDLGQTDAAQRQLNVLYDNATDMAAVLSTYLYQETAPKFLAAYSTGGFLSTLGPDTPVSLMDTALAEPQVSEVFTMTFIFNKEMDPASVQNPYNWTITKNAAGAAGGAYNWGIPTPSTDVPISPIPLSVVYDADHFTATVSFVITQNATADGTLDPSHITFKFLGKDAYGNAMNPAADEYNGVSIII